VKILLTGATGFVGQALLPHLRTEGMTVRVASRRTPGAGVSGIEHARVADIGPGTDWRMALTGVDTVLHLAARVHVLRDVARDPLVPFRAVNVAGTLNLAEQAIQAGVGRFVYVSSIKVNGEGRDAPYTESDLPAPEDAYAISKWEAEQGLRELASRSALEVVILRPPLIYGPGVKANFLRLMQVVHRGWPLPLGAVHNRRSLLYLGNFVDVLTRCVLHPAAAGQTFLLADGEDVSSPELIRRLAAAMERPPRLLPVPESVLRIVGVALGKRMEMARLLGSLTIDAGHVRRVLDWQPPFSLDKGLHATVEAFCSPAGKAAS
jgi:nucleoside-diphosphate-sugar epimerase